MRECSLLQRDLFQSSLPIFFLGSSAASATLSAAAAVSSCPLSVFLCLLDSSLDFFLVISALRYLSASVSGPRIASKALLNSVARSLPSAKGRCSLSNFKYSEMFKVYLAASISAFLVRRNSLSFAMTSASVRTTPMPQLVSKA